MTTNQVKFITALLFAAFTGNALAQFNTLRRKDFIGYEIMETKGKESSDTINQEFNPHTDSIAVSVSLPIEYLGDKLLKNEKCGVRKKHLGLNKENEIALMEPSQYPANNCKDLPELTIINLLEEIKKNGIQHEKIVLAQAILETGWFTSPVCRRKNNLFGLTNPRTGRYYEFRHWTESVRAYYDKVQYRYRGGNYLLWLKEIGYAEDPRYVSSLIRILRQYMM